jgi:hypothetical protein
VIQHLEAILIIIGTLAVWALYAVLAVAGVVMAITSCSNCCISRSTGSSGGPDDEVCLSSLVTAPPNHDK